MASSVAPRPHESLLLGTAMGVVKGDSVRDNMAESWRCIKQDASFIFCLTECMVASVEKWFRYVYSAGGASLRALFIATAVIFPQLWHALGEHPNVYPVLREQVVAFLYCHESVSTCERYLQQVSLVYAEMVPTVVAARPVLPSFVKRYERERDLRLVAATAAAAATATATAAAAATAAPKRNEGGKEKDEEEYEQEDEDEEREREQLVKTRHHLQLMMHLEEPENDVELMQFMSEVNQGARHVEFGTLLIGVLLKCHVDAVNESLESVA